jgi:cobalt-zinc-cadmium efflux system outer membrane protein
MHIESLPPPEQIAQPAGHEGLSLDQLEQMAMAANPSLARASALVGAARGTWVQAGLCPNPSVGYEGQQLGSGGLAEQQGVLVSQEIVRGGKLRLSRNVAASEIGIARQDAYAQQLRVLTDVRMGFYQVLVAQRQIDLTDRLIQISKESLQAADGLFQAKEVGRGDVLQAELEMENANILARNARNRHDAAWRSLASVVGEPRLPPQPLLGDASGPPQLFDFAETKARILAASPEISAAELEVNRARAALQRARVEPIPNVMVQGLVNARDNGIGGKPDGGLAVTVPVPLFNRNQGNVRRAQYELTAAQQALYQVELELQNRLAPTFERYANASNQAIRYREKILPAAQESLDLNRKAYMAGELNYVGLLTAQRTYFQTHLNYLDAVRSLRIAEVQLEGLLLQDSLQFGASGPPPQAVGSDQTSVPIGGLELFRR